MQAPKFREFISEEKTEPYRLVVLSHKEEKKGLPSSVLIRKKAKKLGMDVLLAEFVGCYTHYEANKQFINTVPVDEEGEPTLPIPKEEVKYDKPFLIGPENTILMLRGMGTPGVSGNRSWYNMGKDFEHQGFTLVNSIKCHDICDDKVMTQIIFERNDFRTPKTVRIPHSEGSEQTLKELDSKFPIILKTGLGTNGVGVILVESFKSLQSIVQLLYRESEYIDILLQEYIKSDYDVRVIVCGDEIVGVMKRPVATGDFRSNVAQGSEGVKHTLTELEKSESLRAAQSVNGTLVGVDFIPAKNREKDLPYFIEVNSKPGLTGIEEVLKKDGSITEKILKKLSNRSLWKH